MDAQELNKRLLEIAKGSQNIAKTERACWLDGAECPYGRPGGQFLKRPEKSCVPKTEYKTGCLKLSENLDDFEDLMREDVREDLERAVSEKVNKAATSVSSELSALADNAGNNQVKGVLKLAAELVKEEGSGLVNRKIVLLEDLEIE